jgi:arginine:pyruvate transaminase
MSDDMMFAPLPGANASRPPEPSRRAISIVGDATDGWGVHYRAREMAAAGRDVILLSVGDHDVLAGEDVIGAMAASAYGGALGYAPTAGTAALRAAIARRSVAMTGAETAPEHVMVTAGGQAALFAAMQATMDPGDACVLIDPFYATFPLTVRAAAGRVVAVGAEARDGFLPRPGAVAEAMDRAGARALLINSPNNPTGAVYPPALMAELLDVCARRGAWLISDELYDSQVFDGAHVSPRALPGGRERVIVIGSMSKSHAMTGFRVGWLIGPDALIRRAADMALAMTYGVAGFAQDAALFALGRGAAPEREIAERYRRRRDLALRALKGSNLLRTHAPAGGMYLMIDVRRVAPDGETFAQRLLDAELVSVLPGETFGAAAAGHVRVALTASDDRLAEALSRMKRFAGG